MARPQVPPILTPVVPGPGTTAMPSPLKLLAFDLGALGGRQLWRVGVALLAAAWPAFAQAPVASLREKTDDGRYVLQVAFSPDGKTLAALVTSWKKDSNVKVLLWDVPSRKQVATL